MDIDEIPKSAPYVPWWLTLGLIFLGALILFASTRMAHESAPRLIVEFIGEGVLLLGFIEFFFRTTILPRTLSLYWPNRLKQLATEFEELNRNFEKDMEKNRNNYFRDMTQLDLREIKCKQDEIQHSLSDIKSQLTRFEYSYHQVPEAVKNFDEELRGKELDQIFTSMEASSDSREPSSST